MAVSVLCYDSVTLVAWSCDGTPSGEQEEEEA